MKNKSCLIDSLIRDCSYLTSMLNDSDDLLTMSLFIGMLTRLKLDFSLESHKRS